MTKLFSVLICTMLCSLSVFGQSTDSEIHLTKVNLDDKAIVYDVCSKKTPLEEYDFSGETIATLDAIESKLTIHADGTVDKEFMPSESYFTIDRYYLTREDIKALEDSLCQTYQIYTQESISPEQYSKVARGKLFQLLPKNLFGDRYFAKSEVQRLLKPGPNRLVPVLIRVLGEDGTQYYVTYSKGSGYVLENYFNKYIEPLIGQKIKFTIPYVQGKSVGFNGQYGSLCLSSYALQEPEELLRTYNGYKDSEYEYTITDITFDPQEGEYLAVFNDKDGNQLKCHFSLNTKITYIEGSGECNDIASDIFLTETQRDNFIKYIEPYKAKAEADLEAKKARWAKADKESKEQFKRNKAKKVSTFTKKYGAHYANLLAANKFEKGMSKQMLLEWYTTMDMKLEYRGDRKEVWIRTVTLNDLRKYELTFINGRLAEYHVIMP